jgi:ribonucleoside-diphosphate reductase beta chain
MGANKYSIFPIGNEKIWEAFKTHQAAFWTAEELDFSQDISDLKKLNDNELHFVKHILAFFSQSDGIVNENLCMRFYNDVDMPEAKAFYSMQILIETIHAEVYGLLIDTYVPDDSEKDYLFNAIETIPTIKEKADWALKWISSQDDFAKRLVAFAIVEGIFFSGAFCAIYWLRKRQLLPGLAAANDFIARDEGLHWTFAATLFKEMKLKVNKKDFKDVVSEAVEIEKRFICDSLPVSLIGMNSDLMSQYIEYTADRLCKKFEQETIYNVEQPFDFMKLIDMEGKTNFFEKRVTEYQKPQDRSLNFDSDF